MIWFMKKFVFWFIIGSILLVSCTPSNYFLVNSDFMAKYNRVRGDWEIIWNNSVKHLAVCPDSMPVHSINSREQDDSVHVCE